MPASFTDGLSWESLGTMAKTLTMELNRRFDILLDSYEKPTIRKYENFVLFSHLPYDLRQMIWEQALRPHHLTGKRAIHRIKFTQRESDFSSAGPVIFSCGVPFLRYRAEPLHGRTNRLRSAYLYDAGMWTACKESRRIIAKRSGILMAKYTRTSLPKLNSFPFYTIPGYTRNHPHGSRLHREPDGSKAALMTARGNSPDESYQFHAYPSKDIFLVDTSDWRMTRTCNSMLFYYPFSVMLGMFNPPPEIAFEYDNSWAWDLPMSVTALFQEASARGYFIRVLRACIRDEIECKAWLIDSATQLRVKKRAARASCDLEFYDCSREYVHCSLKQIYMQADSSCTNVADFVNVLLDLVPEAVQGTEPSFQGVVVCKGK